MTDQKYDHTPRDSAIGLIALLSFAAVIDITISPTGALANVLIAIMVIPGVIFTLNLIVSGIERVIGL